jgi:hypothetical protein
LIAKFVEHNAIEILSSQRVWVIRPRKLDASAPEINPKLRNIGSGVEGLGKFEEIVPDNSFGLRVGRTDERISRSLLVVFYRCSNEMVDRRYGFSTSSMRDNNSKTLI